MAVPYTFGSATTSIPLSQLDSNFATTITLGNTAIQLGNTVTTLNNMTLANVTVSSGNVAVATANVTTGNVTTLLTTSVTNSGLTSGRVVYTSTGGLETSSANLLFDGTTLTVASRGIAKAGMPAGSVLQVVQGTFSTQSSVTGTTATATGITATITPTSSTSKIFILVSIPAYNASPAANANFTIYKNGSPLNTIAYFQGGAAALADTYTGVLIDSPATTSATTYAIYAVTAAAATVYWAFGNYQCSITLMEIAV